MDFLKEIVKEIGDDYTKLGPILTRLNNMWIRVRTFLTDLFQGLYLVVYLGIRLLPFGESSTGKTFFPSLSLKISLTLILTGIAYILILASLTSLLLQVGVLT